MLRRAAIAVMIASCAPHGTALPRGPVEPDRELEVRREAKPPPATPPPPHTPGLGWITGLVADSHGHRLEAATVVVSSADRATTLSTLSDAHGLYEVADVAPGDYDATFYYGDGSREVANIRVEADRASTAFAMITVPVPGWGPLATPRCADVPDAAIPVMCFP